MTRKFPGTDRQDASAAAYQKQPSASEMAAHERAIRRAGATALVVTVSAFAAGYFLLGRMVEFPATLAERLAFAIQASAFVLVWVLIAVAMVSTARRRSPADIGGSAAGPPSPAVAVRSAFLQNTLEQALLATGGYLALATLVGGDGLAVVAVSVVLFAIGRVLFYRGYPRGAAGRALGMTLTMTPTLLIYLAAFALLALGLLDRTAM
jgi:uncharacterized membrane protein YecN with MAPEG domain